MNSKVEQVEGRLVDLDRTVAAQNAARQQPNTLAAALEAKARADIYARYEMALRRPRNWDQVRVDILKECHRPSFAADISVLYNKPIGTTQKIEGLGIRFVEMAINKMSNIATDVAIVYEDEATRVLNVTVTDLETNRPETDPLTMSKTVERSKPASDGSFISVRNNSQGKLVYTIPATDEEVMLKQNALVSRIRRNLGLRHIPADLQEACKNVIRAVRADRAAKDPDAERHEIVDGFAKINVSVDQLREYLGHDVGGSSPGELVTLRSLWGAIADGETSWAAVMAQRQAEVAGGKETVDTQQTDQMRQRAAQRAARRARGVAAAEATLEAARPAAPPQADTGGSSPPNSSVTQAAPPASPKAPGVLMVADTTGEFLGRYTGSLDRLVEGSLMEIEEVDYVISIIRNDKIVLKLAVP